MAALLALDADHRAVSNFLVGCPAQRHPNRKTTRRIVSNDLNTGYGFATGPLSNCLQALFSKRRVAQSNCF